MLRESGHLFGRPYIKGFFSSLQQLKFVPTLNLVGLPVTRGRINCLNTLRRKHRRSPTLLSKRKILDLEHKLLNHILEAKLLHQTNLVSNSSPNDIGNITRYRNSCSSSRQLPSVMSMDSVTALDDSIKANLFNQFFSVLSSHAMTNQSQIRSPPEVCIGCVNILPADVYKTLTQLKTPKSMGIDQIGPVILKHCASAIFLPHHLFCQSLMHGVLPQEWKVHLITPSSESGERSDVKNCRPITLLCSVSKVLERLVFDHITTFIVPLITTSQFGFVKGKSSQQQLLVMVHQITPNLEAKL
uniref:Reverse transcriptase domain-containing protein n=1 Tax=Amphimedon queenslandica TaxID=400682 RepID=A0A1X7VW29_AMPQE